jgi:hypothetical protein
MSDFFSLDDDNPVSDGEESGSLHRNCLKELALEQLQDSDYSDAASDISEDLPEGTDWSSLPVTHRKHDRNVDEVAAPPLLYFHAHAVTTPAILFCHTSFIVSTGATDGNSEGVRRPPPQRAHRRGCAICSSGAYIPRQPSG